MTKILFFLILFIVSHTYRVDASAADLDLSCRVDFSTGFTATDNHYRSMETFDLQNLC